MAFHDKHDQCGTILCQTPDLLNFLSLYRKNLPLAKHRRILKMKRIYLLPLLLLLTFFINSCKIPQSGKYEIRAIWMSRFEYARDKTVQESKQYIESSFRKFARAGINVILFQVRGNGDAFYRSDFEPWSDMLSDKIGEDPGWDPLEFAIEQARLNNLELHAWLNTFPAWRAGDPLPEPSQPMHPILLHPDWVVCDSAGNPMKPDEGYISFTPGNPGVQQHIIRVVLDIIHKYDVDGIHFDYIRYPEQSPELGYSHDSVTMQRINSSIENPANLTLENFQREQVSNFVTKVYNAVTGQKPWIKMSAALIGHHHNSSWNGYHDVYQDAGRWLAVGKIDIVFLMTYTSIGHPTAPYERALEQWQQMTHLGRPIVPGLPVYKVGRSMDWSEILEQMNLIRSSGFPGMVFFSANSLNEDLDEIQSDYFPREALLPPMPWKNSTPPEAPEGLTLSTGADSLRLSWLGNTEAVKWVLYKGSDINDPENMVHIFPGQTTRVSIPSEDASVRFYLTAVSRSGVESQPADFYGEKVTANEFQE